MISYTKRNVVIISLIITVIIYILLNYIYSLVVLAYSNIRENSINNNVLITKSENINNKYIWQLEIPKINLVSPIKEGIDSKTINKYVGHFPTTSKTNGNIGLAAHNRRFSNELF